MRDESNRITTAGICIDKDHKVLIGKRIEKGTIGNTWEFPGGKNRWGETVEDTLKREFKEELGVDIEVEEELATHDFENKGVSYHLKAHRIVLKDENPEFTLLVHTELKWEDFDKLDNYDFAPSDWAIILKLRQKHDIIG